jgi:hypothetical protein
VIAGASASLSTGAGDAPNIDGSSVVSPVGSSSPRSRDAGPGRPTARPYPLAGRDGPGLVVAPCAGRHMDFLQISALSAALAARSQ